MIHHIPSSSRHHEDFGWLDTRWHFSFDHYYDPKNTNWGVLRVFNDDVVQPGQGFGTHPHRDMEIVSYVLEGALEHQDSLGTREVLRAGELQVMSAGTGILHSEYNHSATEPVHFLQLWIRPRRKGLEPRWEQRKFDPSGRAGRLRPVVSPADAPKDGALTIDQDATIYLADLAAGAAAAHRTTPDRKLYLFVIAGAVEVNGLRCAAGDQARIEKEASLDIRAAEDARIMLLDLAA